MMKKEHKITVGRLVNLHVERKKLYLSLLILMLSTLIGFLFFQLGFNDSNIIMLYLLAVFLIAIITANRIYSIIFSFISVLIFNYFFTFPLLSLSAYDSGYPMTFVIMFTVAFVTSTLAAKIQQNSHFSALIAQRTRILLETNQMLQKEITKEGIIQKGCEQLYKLLKRDIVFYPYSEHELQEVYVYPPQTSEHFKDVLSDEIHVARWVAKHNRHGGASTDYLPNSKYLYLAVRADHNVYGVLGIYLDKEQLDSYENDILLAILGEIAFALEIEHINDEKKQSELKAKNEQLRADLLRSISHDLRTPLTSISGNADMLVSKEQELAQKDRLQLYEDIYDDSLWLINLVENLLSITRMEEGAIRLKLEPQMIEDILYEALKHVSRKKKEHHLHVQIDDDLLMADMEAHLIIQVIINLVDNAIKYTPQGSNITLHAYQKEDMVTIEVYDDGAGIPDDKKEHIFDKFYRGNTKIVDSKRSLGLGLALCKSIVHSHGGEIHVMDRIPHGAMFYFTLPATKLKLEENGEVS